MGNTLMVPCVVFITFNKMLFRFKCFINKQFAKSWTIPQNKERIGLLL